MNITNYFASLDLDINFNLDLKDLEKAYFAKQVQFHPDRFVGKSEQERNDAALKSITINEAYETLKNMRKRAEHILALNNIIVNKDGSGMQPSFEVLQEVMQLREELQDIKDIEDKNNFKKDILNKKQALIEELKANFLKSDFEKAATNTTKLRYIEKIEQDC